MTCLIRSDHIKMSSMTLLPGTSSLKLLLGTKSTWILDTFQKYARTYQVLLTYFSVINMILQ